MTDPRHEQLTTPEELRRAADECERLGRTPRADRLRRRARALEAEREREAKR